MNGLIRIALLCVLWVNGAAARSELFVTAYTSQDVSLTGQIGSPVPLRDLRHIDIYYSKLDRLVRCHIHPVYRCIIYRDQLDMVIIPHIAVNDTTIPVTTVGFTLNEVTILEAGTYSFQTDYHGDYFSAVLYILQKPEIPLLVHQQPHVGHMMDIHCSTTSQSLPAEYNARFSLLYTWTLKGLLSDHKQNKSVLTIQNVQKADIGARISCHAQEENSTLVSDESPVLTLDVYYLEDIHFSDGLDQQEILEGSKVTKTCQAVCNPECQYQWVDETGLILGRGTVLTLLNVGLATEGTTYICEATNDIGTLTKPFHIDVLYIPEIIYFHAVPNPAVEGDVTKIICAVKNTSDAEMTISANGTIELITSQPTIKLEHTWDTIDCALNGDYECRAWNQYGVVSQTLKMDVRCPPRIIEEISTKRRFEVSDGTPFSLGVNMIANPFPEEEDIVLEHLLRNGQQLKVEFTALVNSMDNKITINIPSVTKDDYGMYALTIHNEYGHMVVLFEIIDPKPDSLLIGLSVSLALSLAASVLLGILWYFRGKVNKRPCNEEETSPDPPIYENSAFDPHSPHVEQPGGSNYQDLGPDKHMASPELNYQDLRGADCHGVDKNDPDMYEEVRAFSKRT